MFGKFHKRYQTNTGVKWYSWLIDLLIVFIGVYLAFLFNGYSESQKNRQQQIKVLNSLKYELEILRFKMPETEAYQADEIKKWQAAMAKDSIIDFYHFLFIQPQYDYTALEYAININEVEVVNYELFSSLRKLYNDIKRLESSENLMTNTAEQFRSIPTEVKKSSTEYQARFADNRFYFFRFIKYAQARKENMGRIAESAKAALIHINKNMDHAQRISIEKELLIRHLQRLQKLPPKLAALEGIKRFFPHFTKKEWQPILDKFYEK